MARLRLAQAALLGGAALLVAGYFMPWLTITMGIGSDGQTLLPLTWDPATVLWNGLRNLSALGTQYWLNSPFLAVCGALYLCGILAVVALALPALRGPRRDGALSPVPWSLMAGAITCGVIALLVWLPIARITGLITFSDVAVPPAFLAGLPLAVAGSLLATAGVIALGTGAATRGLAASAATADH